VARYVFELATDLQARGYRQVSLYLDRNPTHLKRMQTEYARLSAALTIELRFVHFSPYSPGLNPVEYAIHWLRQRHLHHADRSQCLAEVKARLVASVNYQQVFSTEQLVNILVHIEELVIAKQNNNHSP
jgi:transposase